MMIILFWGWNGICVMLHSREGESQSVTLHYTAWGWYMIPAMIALPWCDNDMVT